jgi:hypothetical protein
MLWGRKVLVNNDCLLLEETESRLLELKTENRLLDVFSLVVALTVGGGSGAERGASKNVGGIFSKDSKVESVSEGCESR